MQNPLSHLCFSKVVEEHVCDQSHISFIAQSLICCQIRKKICTKKAFQQTNDQTEGLFCVKISDDVPQGSSGNGECTLWRHQLSISRSLSIRTLPIGCRTLHAAGLISPHSFNFAPTRHWNWKLKWTYRETIREEQRMWSHSNKTVKIYIILVSPQASLVTLSHGGRLFGVLSISCHCCFLISELCLVLGICLDQPTSVIPVLPFLIFPFCLQASDWHFTVFCRASNCPFLFMRLLDLPPYHASSCFCSAFCHLHG